MHNIDADNWRRRRWNQMEKIDKIKFLEVLTALSDLYDAPISQGSIGLYWETLKGYPLDAFIEAGRSHAETSKWMPKPSDFIDAMKRGDMDAEQQSALAWLSVVNAVRDVGSNRGVCFDDPLIHATIRSLGGWIALCRSKSQYFNSTVRASFIKTYAHMLSCAQSGNVLGTLKSLEPLYGAEKGSDMINVSTGLPRGPQHKLLQAHASDMEKQNDGIDKLVRRVSEATEICGSSRRSPEQDVQGKESSRQKVKSPARNDRT